MNRAYKTLMYDGEVYSLAEDTADLLRRVLESKCSPSNNELSNTTFIALKTINNKGCTIDNISKEVATNFLSQFDE